MDCSKISMNAFSLLGVNHTATLDDVKRAYRLRCLELHPDHNDSECAHDDFILLQEAYELLLESISQDQRPATPKTPALKGWSPVWVDEEDNPTYQQTKALGDRLRLDVDALWRCHHELEAVLKQQAGSDTRHYKYTNFISQMICNTAAECKKLENKFIKIDQTCCTEMKPSVGKKQIKELHSSLSTLVISVSTMHQDSVQARAMLEGDDMLTDDEWTAILRKLGDMTNNFYGGD